MDTNPNLEEGKKVAIARCRRRIDAAIHLYRDGIISREDYLADVEYNEREIAHWESRTSETEKAAIEMLMCINMVEKLETLWHHGTDEERQAMVRSLFTKLVYNLDTRRIVDFKLKPWADRFLMIRAQLYGEASGTGGDNSGGNDGNASLYKGKREENNENIGENAGENDDQTHAASVKGVSTHLPQKPVWGT